MSVPENKLSDTGLVSIGIAVYNGGTNLELLLDSIVNQSYQNLEIIISDNVSTDGTQKICQGYIEADDRIRYVLNGSNIGAVANFNRVVQLASGKYFMWAAADDIFHLDYIEQCVSELENNDELVLVGSSTSQFVGNQESSLFVDRGVTLMDDDAASRFLRYRETLLEPTHIGMIFYGLHRKHQLDKVLPLQEIIGSDHLHVAAIALRGKVKTIDSVLAWKRFGGASRSYKEIMATFNKGTKRVVKIPFLKREAGFQKQIKIQIDRPIGKLFLAYKSMMHFVVNNILLRSKTGQKMRLLRKLGLKNLVLMGLYFSLYQRKPWSRGYYAYKAYFLEKIINDPSMMSLFINKEQLPPNFGFRLDERTVEYLWVCSRLKLEDKKILDAGSALNFPYLLGSRSLGSRDVTLCTLAPETPHYKDARISYIYNDLRELMLKDKYFDVVTCISTIEHVGMDNTLLYSENEGHKESSLDDYLDVIYELKRVLKEGGKLLLTIPYGTYENYGWLQQFDAKMVEKVITAFEAKSYELEYFRYIDDGWVRSDAQNCSNDSYFDFHSADAYTDDMLAAARSIVCIELTK